MIKEEEYLTYEEAIKFFHHCKEDNVTIIGIERFDEKDGYLIPDIEGIADFSDATFEQSMQATEKFFNYFKDGIFTFVTENDE